MISANRDVNSPQAISLSVIEEGSASTTSKDVKFGDTFRTIRQVFEPEILQRANDAINRDDYDFVDDKYKTILKSKLCSRVYVGADVNQCILPLIPDYWETKVSVQFGPDCRIVNQKKFTRQLETKNKALIELAIKGVEVLAGQFSLQGQTVDLFRLSIIRNFISSEGFDGSGWYRDNGHYSLVVLMNDDSVLKKDAPYYKGGGLETAEFKTKDDFCFYYATEGTVEYHNYEPNKGVFYSNMYKLMHRHASARYVPVEAEKHLAKPREKPVEQRLLLIIMSPSRGNPEAATTSGLMSKVFDLPGRVKSWFVG